MKTLDLITPPVEVTVTLTNGDVLLGSVLLADMLGMAMYQDDSPIFMPWHAVSTIEAHGVTFDPAKRTVTGGAR